jgi:TolA-binding protein
MSEASVLLKKGMDYFHQKKHKEAITELQKLVNLYPDSSLADNAHYNLGIIYATLGKNNKAFYHFKVVVEEYPDSDAAIFAPGKMEELKERLDPSFPIFNDGMDLLKKKDWEAARKKFTEIISQYPDGELVDNAYINLALLELKDGNKPQAITYLKEVVEKYPETDGARLIKEEDLLNSPEKLKSLI